jgi:glycerol-3-phosphate acyltransferase PlsY
MSHELISILAVTLSYLLGAVRSGFFSAGCFRTSTSAPWGAATSGNERAACCKKAALTLLADCFKGLLPVLATKFRSIIMMLLRLCPGLQPFSGTISRLSRLQGREGRGDKLRRGLGDSSWIGLLCLIAWLFAAVVWRYSSLSALLSLCSTPCCLPCTEIQTWACSLFIFGMIYYRHRENIKRLIAGTEPKIGQK